MEPTSRPTADMPAITRNQPTAPLTTFLIGGPADYLCHPANTREFRVALRWAAAAELPVQIIGGGSNVLIADAGVRGLLLTTTAMRELEHPEGSVKLICGAGREVDGLVDFATKRGLSGLEFAAGLPGSLGGAVWMNARAYGSEFSEIVEWAEALTPQGECVRLENSDMNFSYKHSVFQERELYIMRCALRLRHGDRRNIEETAARNLADRQSKKQHAVNSGGCIFKNNYEAGIPSGKLLEEAGLKGLAVGGARIYNEHANFIINTGDATAEDVKALLRIAQREVKRKFNIDIEPEIRFLG